MTQTADVIVIGGGVMGTSIAFHLARRKADKVLLLEKSCLGAGSTGKSGANIRQHYSHPLLATMAQSGLRMFEQFTDIVGGPPVFTRCGLVVVAPARERESLAANVAMQQGLGVKTSLVSPEELRSIDPQASLKEDEVAAFESEAGYCEALQVVSSFASAAGRLGAEIREGEAVTGIDLDAGRVTGVSTSRGFISSRNVVMAAGPWSASVAQSAGATLPVQPCRTQVVLVRRPCDFAGSHPTYADLANHIYFRSIPGDITHLGNIDSREEKAVVDPDNYNEVADREFVTELRAKLNLRYPSVTRGIGRGGFSALYSVTPDWNPIIGRLPGVEGAFCAAGFSGHGFKMSPAVGELMAEMVIDGGAQAFDIHPLRATRFAEGELFRTAYDYKVMG